MSEEVAIQILGVSKEFKLPHEKHGSLKNMVVNRFRGSRSYERQKVLKDVSLEIKKGEFFGIIGRNGNGKSTLLKLLAGIYSPNKGAIQINGKLTPFIELGVGFNPELTGRENVFLNGALLGFSQSEMQQMYEEIVEFAELEKFMDQKIKNYSSGMQVRLAFSIAIRAKSDILLIDEVLAVGDTNFQNKCIEVFEELKREGRTIVFVSHSMGYIRDFCDRVAVINQGKVEYLGGAEKAIDVYNKLNSDAEGQRIEKNNKKSTTTDRLGNGKALIESYSILNESGVEGESLVTGSKYNAVVKVAALETIHNCAIGVMFRKNPAENLYGINNYYHGDLIKTIEAGTSIEIKFNDVMPLNPGSYFVSFAIATMKKGGYEDCDNLDNVMKVNVTGKAEYWGTINSKPEITTGVIK